MFLYQKLIDRSTMRQGFQIPVEFHNLLKAMPGGMSKHGETLSVKVLIDGVEYDAQLKNQGFFYFYISLLIVAPMISVYGVNKVLNLRDI